MPVEIVELDAVKCLMNGGFIAITVGGGGIPVIKDENGNYYNGFDIGWAVDPETREPVHLPGVDFIRVYTALNQYCGWIGETSTEIFMARDMHIYVRPDQHQ